MTLVRLTEPVTRVTAVTTPGPARPRTGPRTVSPPARWGAVLVAVAATVVVVWSTLGGDHVDFEVYARAGARWLAAEDPYALRPELPFTYPPFAVLLSVPMALAPGLALLVLSMLGVASAAWASLRASGFAWHAAGPGISAVAVVAVTVVSVPVLRGLHLGQVNGLVVGLVLVDLLVVPRRWRGLLTGVAAGIKLTPLVFILLPLVRREWDVAARVGTGFALTVVVGALALPAGSMAYWGGLVGDAERVGSPGFADNQSLLGALTRLAPGDATPLWVLSSLVVLGLGVSALIRVREPEVLHGIVVCALVGLLVSPISWSHHWLLLPAAAILCAREGHRMVAGAVLGVSVLAAPLELWTRAVEAGLAETALGALLTSPLTLAGLACLVLLARRRPSTAGDSAGDHAGDQARDPGGPRGRTRPGFRLGPPSFGRNEVQPATAGVCRPQEATTMSHFESNLQDDGTVFPPVTPDPPLPPGQEEIVVPEIIPPADTAGPTEPTEDPQPTEQPD